KKGNAHAPAQSHRRSRRQNCGSRLRSQDIAERFSVGSRGLTVKPAFAVVDEPNWTTNFELQYPASPCASISPVTLGYEFLQRSSRRYCKGPGRFEPQAVPMA